MNGEIAVHDDGSVRLTIHLSEEEARELESPLDDETPIHPSVLGGGREFCALCTQGFYRGRRETIRADSGMVAALKAFQIFQDAFTLRPGRCG